ncbi:hypothetical protein JCM11641_007622 [Rhodosporidiobolus odoratus]
MMNQTWKMPQAVPMVQCYPERSSSPRASTYATTLPHTGFGSQDSRTGAHDTPHVQPNAFPVHRLTHPNPYGLNLPGYPFPHTSTVPINGSFAVNPSHLPPLADPYAPNLPGRQFLPTPFVPGNAPSVFVPYHPPSSMPRNPAQIGRTLDNNYAPHATQAESGSEDGMEDAPGSPDLEVCAHLR